MTTQHTHVIVRDTPPPSHVMTVGRIIPCGPETVFKTAAPTFVSDEEDPDDRIAELEAELAALKGNKAESKVVRGRRPRPPKVNEDTETK